jgi:hypothetical protein
MDKMQLQAMLEVLERIALSLEALSSAVAPGVFVGGTPPAIRTVQR